jgi:hypothetical protein
LIGFRDLIGRGPGLFPDVVTGGGWVMTIP